ncbi:MAG: VWA domain-containing protein [Gammaproteobacteria bacterium]|nr:VWA domain-containing protein [Gammaproteobacteria bacterium]
MPESDALSLPYLQQLQLLWPWMFLLLPLPWLVRRYMPEAHPAGHAALRAPHLAGLLGALPGARGGSGGNMALAIMVWLLLLTAAARPQWVGEPVDLGVSGRDLMIAVDISGSMKEVDFLLGDQAVTRLDAVKKVAGEFIERRAGDRLGLILFGDKAYVQTPLTFDRETVNQLLQEAAIGLAGEKTAIGDAIGLAVKRLRAIDTPHRVLVLLTDGANTAGEVQPEPAAALAAQEGLTLYTIGIGAEEAYVPTLFGMRRVNPSAELDEKMLRSLAEQTGGQFFRARDSKELEQIYHLLDRLEPQLKDNVRFRPISALFYWPLGLALLFASGLLIQAIRGRVA